MSDSQANGSGDGEGEKGKEAAVAKTAGFVVFSGIAMSILKALNLTFCHHNGNNASKPFEKSTPLIEEVKKHPSPRTIEIVKGDTLWGLSRKYGVSIDAIKEANGLSGDTIYAGKKLIIPCYGHILWSYFLIKTEDLGVCFGVILLVKQGNPSCFIILLGLNDLSNGLK